MRLPNSDTAEVVRLCLAVELGMIDAYDAAAWLGLPYDRGRGTCDFFVLQERVAERTRSIADQIRAAVGRKVAT